MEQIPDAPWIREAETYGYPPDYSPILCPECGEECDVIYMDDNNNVLGCDQCIRAVDADTWRQNYGEI